MKLARLLKLSSACVFALSLSLMPAVSAKAQTFINGIDANYPPFAFVNEQGQPDGFDVQALNWIAEKMGFEIKHQPMDWDGIIPALLAKKIDMICSGMSITPSREAQVAFTEPYWIFEKVMVAPLDSDLDVDKVFAGKAKLGVQRGTNEHEYLETKKADEKLNYELRYYDSSPLAIEDLLNGRIQAVALDSFPAMDAIAKGKKIKVIGTFADKDTFGVALRKEDNELRQKVNEGYKLLQQDPYWDELSAKYLN